MIEYQIKYFYFILSAYRPVLAVSGQNKLISIKSSDRLNLFLKKPNKLNTFFCYQIVTRYSILRKKQIKKFNKKIFTFN